MEWLDLSRLIVALVVMAAASYSDWRTRLASDLYWLFLGCVGLGLIIYQIVILNVDSRFMLFVVPLGVVFFDIFWERKGIFEEGINPVPLLFYVAALVSLAYLFVTFMNDILFWQLLSVLVMFLLLMFMYQIDVIKGGADAKALIALSLMFPAYPVIGEFPLLQFTNEIVALLFPFSLLVLFNAAIISLIVPLGLFVYNIAKRDITFPAMFLGYRINIREAKRRFVWPMERIVEGEIKFTFFPKDDEDNEKILEELEIFGVRRIWVTPKIPFLLFITAGIIASAVLGNPVLALLY